MFAACARVLDRVRQRLCQQERQRHRLIGHQPQIVDVVLRGEGLFGTRGHGHDLPHDVGDQLARPHVGKAAGLVKAPVDGGQAHDPFLQVLQQGARLVAASAADLDVDDRRYELQVVLHAVMHFAQQHFLLMNQVFKFGLAAGNAGDHRRIGGGQFVQFERRFLEVQRQQSPVPARKADDRAVQRPDIARDQKLCRQPRSDQSGHPHQEGRQIGVERVSDRLSFPQKAAHEV